MPEYCLCGIPKKSHINTDNLVGKSVADVQRQAAEIQARFTEMLILYGNICTNYQRDNLRYLEEVSKDAS